MRPQIPRVGRVRKLTKQFAQSVVREDQLDAAEYLSLQRDEKVETGVEKSEESELHLQNALKAATKGDSTDQDIPAPPAHESNEIDYDSLYSRVLKPTAKYIRFSETVEECTGCQYDMTTDDDVFLTTFNQKRSGIKCSEDDFEKFMEAFEDTAAEHAPFASIDNTIIPFETMQMTLKQYQQQLQPKILSLAKEIYEYWKLRRQGSGNTALQPSLKFEKNQELDDGDPYVCFRRRDARQTRKTRNRDVQSTEKLKKLRKELEDGRLLLQLNLNRETIKRDLLKSHRDVFEHRVKIKDTKVKMGIKTDDEDLYDQKKKKMPSDLSQQQRSIGVARYLGRPDARSLDADLIQLSDLLSQKDIRIRNVIEGKAEEHQKWNANFVDLTRSPLSPSNDQEASFRPATAQSHYLMTPPSSVTSDSFDNSLFPQESPDPIPFQFNSQLVESDSSAHTAYRRRIGRGGRLWIDRKGMTTPNSAGGDSASDRWKYDYDDDDEQPVYELDPYDLRSLRFRSTIPPPGHIFSQRVQSATANPRTIGTASVNNPGPNPVQQVQAPT